MTLVEKIKDLCQEHGETVASLERKMDFGNGTIRKWDNTTPSGDKLAKVADYFHVSVDYLLGRETRDDALESDRSYSILSREAKRMTPEQRQKLIDIAKIMFDKEFDDT